MYYFQHSISWILLLLLATVRGRQHDRLITSLSAFSDHPFPTITIESPELGPSGSYLDKDHSQEGEGYFPALSWPSPTDDTKEYLLVSEDPDSPLPQSIIHGIYYGIPRVFTGLQHPDFLVENGDNDPFLLRGGFRFGENRGESVYLAPNPPAGHGPHRYFFELIALNETIDQEHLSDRATLQEISEEIEGKVTGWGAWVGLFENK
ncbi:hypothetical protein P175DRAFT_0516947 [Aspergillus ochraceoroseus IBT 24754]|uniref:PEBP-like protein n=3 Tax=Aspergillus subgen. Nidulantes TaxID=2720870 RepID=A0A0F8UKM6_9EURO|nr:uncharacterized protein P175DRAFT_0516947 [Aspergillus ochraceoroseus IBT 24754]KKK16807.1 hypothetical protein AOCH_003314 [Aspergillus ochraceoroseus]KKK20139.1 hypothetical protein ARAM_004362 [Aspergillus rambellii]PTU19891.1 hypothetical protein P175DRAFT_0516947 [Aspergillus ochraceoroseus IBT 24754]